MIKKMRVFDLDNTLVYTNQLNNQSYNYALKNVGLEPIDNCKRITRKVVIEKYTEMSSEVMTKVIMAKQDYFIKNLRKTSLNNSLVNKLISINVEYCILWTSADRNRVIELLKYYGIENRFAEVKYSNKNNVLRDMQEICRMFEVTFEELEVYEDNLIVVEELMKFGINVTIV